MTSPLSHVAAYDAFMGRWSRLVAGPFVDWLSPRAGLRWLDVGCGTGALTSALFERAAPAEVRGLDASADYVAHLEAELAAAPCGFAQGDAQALPFPDDAFDGAVSGLTLNQLEHPLAGVTEMTRVTRPGGTVGLYVWDFAAGMQLWRLFWDAAAELDPAAREAGRIDACSVCNPVALDALFKSAGLASVHGRPFDISTPFASFDELWQPFLRGEGRTPSYVRSLGDEARSRLRDRLRSTVPAARDGSIPLTARAWAVRGTVRESP